MHYGVPPLRRCDLYDGLRGQDVQRSHRQRGFDFELRSTRFANSSPNFLEIFLAELLRCDRPAVRLVIFTADPEPV